MRVAKIHSSNFQSYNSSRQQGENIAREINPENVQDKGTKNLTTRAIALTQHTENKEIIGFRYRSDAMFIAQYIAQVTHRRRRDFIGQRPALQAKKPYENSKNILENIQNNSLDKTI